MSFGGDTSEQFVKVFLHKNLIFRQFAKVLSLKSFPLYGISSSIMRGNVTHTGVSLGSGTMT